jgi:hypothetical protein
MPRELLFPLTVKDLRPIEEFNYTHSDEIDPPDPWQLEDINHMYNRMIFTGHGANWSEMGCKKTTTGLWLIQRLHREYWGEDFKPNVFVCTTSAGKGTFFYFAQHILEDWVIINVKATGLSVIVDGKERNLPGIKAVPERFDMPTLVLCHYHTFSRSTQGQFLTDDDGNTVTKEVVGTDGETRFAMVPKTPSSGDIFVSRKWDLAWLDEAHHIKGKDTKWTVVLKRSKDDMRVDTTGTGFVNRPHEIWSLLNHLSRKKWKDFNGFRDYFCDIQNIDGMNRIVGIKEETKDEFRALVRTLGPRRTLTEVMPHIKEPFFMRRPIDLNSTQRKMYEDIKLQLKALDQKGVPIYSTNVLTLMMRMRQISTATPEVLEDYYDEELDRRVQKITLVEPSSKLDEVMNVLDELPWDEDNKSPVVIFSNFVPTLNLLAERFKKANENAMEMGFEPEYPYLWMKAEDDEMTRYNKWKNMFPTMQYRVFMSTIKLGAESINLTPARHCVFIDRSWSPKDNMQAIGRIRRPGQEGQPVVINIDARNTIDNYMKAVLDLKAGWFDSIFGNEAEDIE